MSDIDLLPQCQRCSLHETANRVVSGRGSIPARVLFLGEAPGRDEDRLGVPFQGRAGQVLDAMLLEYGITEDMYYIDNAVRHRPPNNRKPLIRELEACSVWTKLRIAQVKPELIVTLGESALRAMIPRAKLADLVGQVIELEGGTKLLPAYHPASVLHNPAMMPRFRRSIAAVADQLGLAQNKEVVDYTNTGWLGIVPSRNVLAIDIETDGAYEDDAEIVGVGISWAEGKAVYIDTRGTPKGDRNWRYLQKIIDSAPIIVMHNAKFDWRILQNYGLRIHWEKVQDTMLMAYALRYQRIGLKWLVQEIFNHNMTSLEELTGTGQRARNPRDVPVEEIGPYCCADADYTRRLCGVLGQKLHDDPNLYSVYKHIELPLVPTIVGMEQAGVAINRNTIDLLDQELRHEIVKLEYSLRAEAGSDFNIRSVPQLQHLLYDVSGMQPYRGKRSTDKESITRELGRLENLGLTKNPLYVILKLVAEFRTKEKLRSTYTQALLESVHGDGRIHPHFNQAGAETERMSSGDPINTQTMPHVQEVGDMGWKIRSAFVPAPGKVLVVADQSQIELRIFAHCAQEQAMLDALNDPEGDVHRKTASEIFGIPPEQVTSEQRRIGKMFNFASVYGAGPEALARVAAIPNSEALTLYNAYHRAYPGVRRFFQQVADQLNKVGYSETLFGWRNHYPKWFTGSRNEREASLREAANLVIQGTQAGGMKLAMQQVHRQFRELGLSARLLLQVHDELVAECPEEESGEVKKIMEEALSHCYDSRHLDVVTPCEAHIGSTWAEAKGV